MSLESPVDQGTNDTHVYPEPLLVAGMPWHEHRGPKSIQHPLYRALNQTAHSSGSEGGPGRPEGSETLEHRVHAGVP